MTDYGLLTLVALGFILWFALSRRPCRYGGPYWIVRRPSEREEKRRRARQRLAAYRAAVERGEYPESNGRCDCDDTPKDAR